MAFRFSRRLCITIALLVAAPLARAGLLDQEVSFTEAEVQAAVDRNGKMQRSYGGFATVALQQPPKVALGTPDGRISLSGSMLVAVVGQPPIPVDVQGVAGIRYDDRSKGFFLENPVATSVASPMLDRNSEPFVRQGVSQLMSAYFRSKPIYVLRDDASVQEATMRWLLRSVRIEPGKVVATLSPL
nr:DUF1439 domain-containing protein [Dechloromonas sp.]